nr:MAG TPA: hypothetical protein [Caudoviricetes sp.]
MAYYKICEHCSSNLDPGEHCQCRNEEKKEKRFLLKKVSINLRTKKGVKSYQQLKHWSKSKSGFKVRARANSDIFIARCQ